MVRGEGSGAARTNVATKLGWAFSLGTPFQNPHVPFSCTEGRSAQAGMSHHCPSPLYASFGGHLPFSDTFF